LVDPLVSVPVSVQLPRLRARPMACEPAQEVADRARGPRRSRLRRRPAGPRPARHAGATRRANGAWPWTPFGLAKNMSPGCARWHMLITRPPGTFKMRGVRTSRYPGGDLGRPPGHVPIPSPISGSAGPVQDLATGGPIARDIRLLD
jgi:hypothetical protein